MGPYTKSPPPGPELFFGLVAAIGTDLDRVTEILTGALANVAYAVEVVRLSDLLREIGSGPALEESPRDRRYETYMDKGTYPREQTRRGDALAVMAVRRIRRLRAGDGGGDGAGAEPRTRTLHRLGQNVGDTFPLADVFVDVSRSEEEVRANIERFIALLFGYPFHTPRRDESGMFHARAAALRSAELGRQVGAAIADEAGELLAVGTNEVPRAGGGVYWAPERIGDPDDRDFTHGYDTSDRFKRNSLAEVLTRIQQEGWLADQMAPKGTTELLDDSLPFMRSTRLMNLIEFGRAVHAEMTAITGALSGAYPGGVEQSSRTAAAGSFNGWVYGTGRFRGQRSARCTRHRRHRIRDGSYGGRAQ